MPSTPSNARGIAIPLALFVIGLCMSFALQLHAISHSQQQATVAYPLAARRILLNHKLTRDLRTADTRGSGRIDYGWAQRRYRRALQKGSTLQTDGTLLWIRESLPHFRYATLRIQANDDFELVLRHTGDSHD